MIIHHVQPCRGVIDGVDIATPVSAALQAAWNSHRLVPRAMPWACAPASAHV